jgi:hypothetical protein
MAWSAEQQRVPRYLKQVKALFEQETRCQVAPLIVPKPRRSQATDDAAAPPFAV